MAAERLTVTAHLGQLPRRRGCGSPALGATAAATLLGGSDHVRGCATDSKSPAGPRAGREYVALAASVSRRELGRAADLTR
jgi:hypothetical protein